MHRLLVRQIREVSKPNGTLDVDRLLTLVDLAYEEADREQAINVRSLDVMQTEICDMVSRTRQEAELQFKALMANVGEGVVVTDGDGRIEDMNAAAARLFGRSSAQAGGASLADLLAGDEDRGGYEVLADALAKPGVMETMALRGDGSAFPIELAVGVVDGGLSPRYMVVIRDISARKQAEKELRDSESRFRDLAGSASDWFWETDTDHNLTFVSERISQVLGVNPSAILGASFFDLGLDDAPHLAAEHRADLLARRPFRDRAFHVGPEEGTDSRTIRISGMPIVNEIGDFLGYRGVGVDVTREAKAEKRAHHAQQRLVDAIESIVDGIAVFDSNDGLVICNGEYRRMFPGGSLEPGVPFETIVRDNAGLFASSAEKLESRIQARLEHHRRATGQPFELHSKSGRWLLNREYRMADGGVVGVRTDITRLKQREQEIEQLRRRYELILDCAGEGIAGLDSDGRIIFINQAGAVILGHDAQTLPGHDFLALAAPAGGVGLAITQALADGRPGQAVGEPFMRGDGRPVPVDYFAAPMDDDGERAGAVVVFRDASLRIQYERALADNQRELERLVDDRTRELLAEVDVRARTEAALRESRERMKGITDSLFEGVLVVNRSGHVAFANPSARRQLGWADDEVEGLPVEQMFQLCLGGSCATFQDGPLGKVANGGDTVINDDAQFLTHDGRKLAVAFACSPLLGDDGVRGAILSFRDIGALKQAQGEAMQASRMASVGQLAAGIAHEINTPTQYIGDNLRFLADGFSGVAQAVRAAAALSVDAARAGLDAPVEQFRQAMETGDVDYLLDEIPAAISQSLEGVSQVGHIVLSMKEFSHPGSSNRTLVDINRAIGNVLTVSRNTWKHVADVDLDLDPDLPQLSCFAGELNQVFLNLVVNAAHAIEAAHKPGLGRIHIQTRTEDGHMVIRVADTGTGIPESIKDRIFDPFFTTKEVGKGTGQGLAISRDVVVTKHGGRLELGEDDSGGAAFIIRLPLAPQDSGIHAMAEGGR